MPASSRSVAVAAAAEALAHKLDVVALEHLRLTSSAAEAQFPAQRFELWIQPQIVKRHGYPRDFT